MKTKSIFIFLILFIITSFYSVSGQKAGFSGEWKLNKEKTVLAESQIFLSRITIRMKTDSLLTTRVYVNVNGDEYPFNENISLNGKDCKIFIYEMPRTSKASWSAEDQAFIIESTTTFNGNNGEENMTAKETWKVDNQGKTLTIGFTNKMSGNETIGTNYYDKVN